jgi:hypothetical protein
MFVIQNYKKVKTVEELAQLGGYTISTFRRIFNSVFHEPVYEWMLARRKENVLDDCLIPITVSQRFVINMVSNPCLISPISVKSLLEPLRVH